MKKVFVRPQATMTLTDEDGYISFTGSCNKATAAELYPEFELFDTLHLCDSKTGAPMHAFDNAKYYLDEYNWGRDSEGWKNAIKSLAVIDTLFMDWVDAMELVKTNSKLGGNCPEDSARVLTKVKDKIRLHWLDTLEEFYQHAESVELTTVKDPEDGFDPNDYDDRELALAQYLECHPDEIDPAKYNDDYYEAQGMEFLVVDDDRGDELWDESLDSDLEDCILPDLPEMARIYFDSESWKNDARVDGRAHSLSGYDGLENTEEVTDTTYYIYRTN